MSQQAFDAEAYMDAVAPALDLTVDAAHRAGVIANLQRIAAVAAVFLDAKLADELEPGPVFKP